MKRAEFVNVDFGDALMIAIENHVAPRKSVCLSFAQPGKKPSDHVRCGGRSYDVVQQRPCSIDSEVR